ncbi:MAG: UDP-N-acetylmuramate:L-alanyl-gamma-D-glutamyl-meso-diaminopimelate ligase [Gammaproteobacteria bacterium]|nr:UDP-N-acetylmuramate:L-alanyl-gamma-D-glutamyl-meso-diaminopimelate ligase [Gammaproteobacteria bacterium]NIN60947.1 UDP-N-acetylmuramate:L-alanyl-gamma-D-glutamyl-meso-diaminopimelate ligase [Gammaproteobacteria bacterium]NIO62571.1 UDP-N-acetylmuramate:L-alanyl-gamma-D-glutamyl-meso-diaminopimelate ligase [Gammaproteobacteria bacterium]NIP49512.1 UDP-N-acetylmuramate:L-alanyl-gamma-D-glutamyl-meso-diaminopimelate ligase [Gammaproteobacteria bacterium]NIQ10736.1 UDP-N-acetylmuramate:L-alany
MRIHILGICGTFMGGLALLARELGHEVSGSDTNVYPPMSTQLEEQGIHLTEGYDPIQLEPAPDLVVVGNALGRGNDCIEYCLDAGLRMISGPQWLYEHMLVGKHVLAVAGTHGKTTTAAMLAWSLEVEGLGPGFLIGGIPANVGVSARLGAGKYFVVEADEYDTAFFDKRSKFVHYHPRTLVITNIEFDHADIFADLDAIRRQFHHLIRMIPRHGLIVARAGDREVLAVLAQGCWSTVEYFGETDARWCVKPLQDDYSEFEITVDGEPGGVMRWDLFGKHNAMNALATAAAAGHVGLTSGEVCEALANFKNVKRRLEHLVTINNISVYDDFAHHPTEIEASLEALRSRVGKQRIIAVMEPRSNTMRQGVHKARLAAAFELADQVLLFRPDDLSWDLEHATRSIARKREVFADTQQLIDALVAMAQSGDQIVIMSNGSFANIHQRLIEQLQASC